MSTSHHSLDSLSSQVSDLRHEAELRWAELTNGTSNGDERCLAEIKFESERLGQRCSLIEVSIENHNQRVLEKIAATEAILRGELNNGLKYFGIVGVVAAVLAVLFGGSLWQRIDTLTLQKLDAVAVYSREAVTGIALAYSNPEEAITSLQSAYRNDKANGRVVEPLVGFYLEAIRHQQLWPESKVVIEDLRKRSPSLRDFKFSSLLLNIGYNLILRPGASADDLALGVNALKRGMTGADTILPQRQFAGATAVAGTLLQGKGSDARRLADQLIEERVFSNRLELRNHCLSGREVGDFVRMRSLEKSIEVELADVK